MHLHPVIPAAADAQAGPQIPPLDLTTRYYLPLHPLCPYSHVTPPCNLPAPFPLLHCAASPHFLLLPTADFFSLGLSKSNIESCSSLSLAS